MGDQNQPLDHRAQTIADYRALLDYLADRPDVPLDRYGDALAYSVRGEDDEAGVAEVARIAAALGVLVTDNGGRPATAESNHLIAELKIGHATYSACYIRREWMRQYDENQRWLAERRAVES